MGLGSAVTSAPARIELSGMAIEERIQETSRTCSTRPNPMLCEREDNELHPRPVRSGLISLREQCQEISVAENMTGLFGRGEDAIDHRVAGGDAALFEPEDHVGAPTHWPDLNHLLKTEKMRRHSAINRVGQQRVALAVRFDDRRSMHAGSGAEGVPSDDRIIRRDDRARGPSHRLAVFLQPREVAVNQSQKAEIDQQKFHGSVAYTLTK